MSWTSCFCLSRYPVCPFIHLSYNLKQTYFHKTWFWLALVLLQLCRLISGSARKPTQGFVELDSTYFWWRNPIFDKWHFQMFWKAKNTKPPIILAPISLKNYPSIMSCSSCFRFHLVSWTLCVHSYNLVIIRNKHTFI